MSNSNKYLSCPQCEERLGEVYMPLFTSTSRVSNTIDETGYFIDEIDREILAYFCANCGQQLIECGFK